ncbi:MAG: type IIL restriction-modification enzyme MmeI, partial [Sulfuriferula sp.]
NANALQIDWAQVCPQARFILGNPPFIGHQWRSKQQQADVDAVFPKDGKFGKVDFVGAWFVKAADYMATHPPTRAAFVSTNSITQGEQVGILWGWMLAQGLHIQFAHRTFSWSNEASGNAAVHCVIVGFGLENTPSKTIYIYDDIKGEPHAVSASNINPYLVDAPNVLLPSRSQPPKGMPAMTKGSQPTDGGHLIISPDERTALLSKYPDLTAYIKPFIGGYELLNGTERYCLWFADASPAQLKVISTYPEIKARIEGVKKVRLASPTASVQAQASQPYLFTQNRQPKTTFLAVPEVSSERRHYIPIGFLTADNVPSNLIYMLPDVGLYEFGVLTSALHNA